MGKGAGDANCQPGMGGLLDGHQEWLSGWALTHDYDPTWDYEVRFDLRHHRLALLAQSVAEKITKDNQLPWMEARVYPANLEGPLATYVSGTSGAPVVVIDLDSHNQSVADMEISDLALERAVADSVLHELRHAYQEAHEWLLDEDEAEHGSEHIPF